MSKNHKEILAIARNYLESELCPIPTVPRDKRPSTAWTRFQTSRPTEQELETLFANAGDGCGIGLVCGAVSGNLETLDFDDRGSAFESWKAQIPLALYSRLTVEQTPSGGYHVYYRCEGIGRNDKLAMTPDGKVLIETRGEGGFIVCAPTKGYSLIQGNFYSVPIVTETERQLLIDAAKGLDQAPPPTLPKPKPKPDRREVAGESPADAYNKSGDYRLLLEKHGWKYEFTAADENEHWTRPGKDKGTSATIKVIDGVPILYNFSSNAGIVTEKGLNPFQLYAELEHDGDLSAAAKNLSQQGYGNCEYRSDDETDCTDESDESSGFGTPISIDRQLDTWTPFPLDTLPTHVRLYVERAAKALNVDAAGVACSLLVTAGATIGARLKLRLPGVDRSVAPILWVMLIGSSASGKSPTMFNSGLNLLKGKKREFQDHYHEQMDTYKKELKKYEAVEKKIARLEESCVESELEGEYDAVTDCNQKIKKYKESDIFKRPPKRPVERIIDISGTFSPEGLIDKASENPLGYLLFQDELTQVFKCLTENQQVGATGSMLSAFDGCSVRTALKTVELNRTASSWWMSILGGIVPDNLLRYVANTERLTDGFLSRFLLSFAPLVPYEEYKPESADLGENSVEYQDMKKIFDTIADYKGAFRQYEDGFIEESRYARLSDEAQSAYNNSMREIYKKQLDCTEDIERSLFGKSKNYLGRLILLLHILEAVECFNFDVSAHMPNGLETYTETTPVSIDTFERAKRLLDWWVDETRKIYQLFGFAVSEMLLDKIVAVLKNAGKALTSNEIGQKINLKGSVNKERRERLLKVAVQKNLITAEERHNSKNGKVSIYYSVQK